ncbi:MAG: fibro-slime domain-containing protein [Myxococcales bacterium]|jgi:fibro-slime domain-containing protein|nr:fibro-slime domain-containing protein [Myxococcales bacterium]
MTLFRMILTLALVGTFGAMACSDDDDNRGLPPGNNNNSVNNDNNSANNNTPGNNNNNFNDGNNANNNANNNTDIIPSCQNSLKVVFRDFTSSHPDFERADLGWGPAKGMIQPTLNADRKPVFSALQGTHKIEDSQCSDTCPNGGLVSRSQLIETGPDWGSTQMWEGASTFPQWYTDVEGVNMRVEDTLILQKEGDSYVYDNPFFFPLDGKGFGAEPGQLDDNGVNRNFLFTTEIHFEFEYTGNQIFTFRGDDDLWIFVNDKLALDLGGLHWPFEDTINFDAIASEFGLEVGGTYKMDIFHAERHTKASNFRIQTNIACFIPTID